VNLDFRDLLAEFNAHKVEFLIVGAHALAAHGCVRATKDLDVWIRPESENAKRTLAAIRAFGAPLHDLTESDLITPGEPNSLIQHNGNLRPTALPFSTTMLQTVGARRNSWIAGSSFAWLARESRRVP
jgi:hypothetical protein